MENIKVGCIPVRQAIKIDSKTLKIKKFIKRNKLRLIIGGVFVILISIYCYLIMNFIKLIQVINYV